MTSNTVQLGHIAPGYVDKRRLPGANVPNDRGSGTVPDFESRVVEGGDAFVANAAGTTTTIVGANAAPGTSDANVVRRGEKVKLFNSSGVLKEEKVFEITTIAVGASTTVTFTPAAAVATASGDILRRVGTSRLDSMDDIDDRLLALGFSQANVDRMTLNDKLFQIRVSDDPGSL